MVSSMKQCKKTKMGESQGQLIPVLMLQCITSENFWFRNAETFHLDTCNMFELSGLFDFKLYWSFKCYCEEKCGEVK